MKNELGPYAAEGEFRPSRETPTDLEYREAAMRLSIQSYEHRDPSPGGIIARAKYFEEYLREG